MSNTYDNLSDRIRGETPELDRLVKRTLSAWEGAKQVSGEQEIYLDSVALNLHGFYSAIERLFELIARHLDQSQPTGEMWHRDLLKQMSHEVENIRPAVISRPIASSLDNFRRFRHLVRNIYTFNLAPDKIESLIIELPDMWTQLQEELTAFADFLTDLAKATRKL